MTDPRGVRAGDIGAVFLGGAVGTAARESVTLTVPSIGSFPIAVLAINLAGSFALGLLLESLARRGATSGRADRLRLLCGTGFLGGFTTYSALSGDAAALLLSGDLALGLGYGVGSVVAGAVAAGAGILLAARLRRQGGADT